jgi:hypothetical protein
MALSYESVSEPFVCSLRRFCRNSFTGFRYPSNILPTILITPSCLLRALPASSELWYVLGCTDSFSFAKVKSGFELFVVL